jgi:hypothetical protein
MSRQFTRNPKQNRTLAGPKYTACSVRSGNKKKRWNRQSKGENTIMTTYPLLLRGGLMFVEHEGSWLIDTGSPVSLSRGGELCLDGVQCDLQSNLMGFAAEDLSGIVGFEVTGLIGNDAISRFDWIFDLPNQTVSVSRDELHLDGSRLPVETFLTVPLLQTTVSGQAVRALLDTGAELSYFPPSVLDGLAPEGNFRDFHPFLGWFDTELRKVHAVIANHDFVLRAGVIGDNVGLLGLTLSVANANGLIGNQIFHDRRVGYFPRRGTLILDGSNGHAAA